MKFTSEGHIDVTPAEVFKLANKDISRLIDDVLWQGTPRTFDTYAEYRDFVGAVASSLSVHPSCLVFRGSTRLGFSMTPRSGKIWVEAGRESDVDLAIVDPDHFHFLDAEVRRWERHRKGTGKPSGAEINKLKELAKDRSCYCYRHFSLPDTSLVAEYKATMERASKNDPPLGCGRTVTAFFYRDWWSLHAREERDIRDILERTNRGNLPRADGKLRPRLYWGDEELSTLDPTMVGAHLCLSSLERISDDGLQHLGRLPGLQSLWLDDMDAITDAGMKHVGKLSSLTMLSICSKMLTDGALRHLHGLKKLERLYYDRNTKRITKDGLKELNEALPDLKIQYR